MALEVMDAGASEQLRKPFPAETVGQLPKAGIQLDYVGHAAVTDRLLSVDPDWCWEPFALDTDGLPAVIHDDREASLWIRLTVCGVTRIGVGTSPANTPDLYKKLIGDALRNAAMRFGVALDLWSKDELESQVAPPPDPRILRVRHIMSKWADGDPRFDAMRTAREERGWPSSVSAYSSAQLDDALSLLADLDTRPQPDAVDPTDELVGDDQGGGVGSVVSTSGPAPSPEQDALL